jgi:hypothetical protein
MDPLRQQSRRRPFQGHRSLRPRSHIYSSPARSSTASPTFEIKAPGRNQLMADLAVSAVARFKAVTESTSEKSTAAWFRWQPSPADRHLRRLSHPSPQKTGRILVGFSSASEMGDFSVVSARNGSRLDQRLPAVALSHSQARRPKTRQQATMFWPYGP